MTFSQCWTKLELRVTHSWGFIFKNIFLFYHLFLFSNTNSSIYIYIYVYVFFFLIISTLMKCFEKNLHGNYIRILSAILNKSWKQYSTKQQLYGHLPPISQTIKARWKRYAGHSWKSKDELISKVILCASTHGYTRVSQPTKTYIYQLCVDTICCLVDLSKMIDDRDRWWEREKKSKESLLAALLYEITI